MRTIQDLIKKDKGEMKLIQSKIPISLFLEVKEIMTGERITWRILITACLEWYAQENRKHKQL